MKHNVDEMQNSNKTIPLLSLKNVSKTRFQDSQLIISNINLDIYEGEIIALLGRSGSGKSTLMRIMAGLLSPSSGKILYNGKPFHGTTPNMSMVFQKPSLLPWLTVMENIALVLENSPLSKIEKEKRTLDTIASIGLEGYENAYPTELSTDMCQRACIARALSVRPDIILMDEPFSALDVLTVDNLWEDLFSIWHKGAIVFVTHNIEEAVLYSSKIIVLDGSPSNGPPGIICGIIDINLPRQRNCKSKEVIQLIDSVYFMIAHHGIIDTEEKDLKKIRATNTLPDVEVSELIGLLIAMNELQSTNTPIDLPLLAEYVDLDIDDLFPIIEALSMFNFAVLVQGDIVMTRIGKNFLEADMDSRKDIFAEGMKTCIPFTKILLYDLEKSEAKSIKYFSKTLSQSLGKDRAEQFLKVFIRWGRYADILGYDSDTGYIYIVQPSLHESLHENQK